MKKVNLKINPLWLFFYPTFLEITPRIFLDHKNSHCVQLFTLWFWKCFWLVGFTFSLFVYLILWNRKKKIKIADICNFCFCSHLCLWVDTVLTDTLIYFIPDLERKAWKVKFRNASIMMESIVIVNENIIRS